MSRLIVSAHQANIFPYVGFFRRFICSDIFDLSPFDHFTSGSEYYCHRVKIGTDDKWEYLAAPLEQSHNKYRGREIAIRSVPLSQDNDKWQEFYKLLDKVYSKYPYYTKVMDFILPYLQVRTNLADFNIASIQAVRDCLELSTPIGISSVPYGLTTSKRVLFTIKQYKPNVYISGNIGKTYINTEEWNNEGITVKYADEFSYDVSLTENMNTVSILSYLFKYSKEEVINILTPIKD